MKTLFTRVLPIFIFLTILIPLHAQVETINGAEVSEVRFLGKTTALRDKVLVAVPDIHAKKKLGKSHFSGPDNFEGNVPMQNNNTNALPVGVDPVRQIFGLTSVVIPVEPLLNFEGINSNESGSTPPDTNGDVSPDHYVQSVNGGGSLFEIFDKDGNSIMGPVSMNNLWTEFNGQGLGDPVILWDPGVERWLFSELKSDFASVMVAVSETSDPTGSFYAYEFQAPALPDYPKYGVWPDAYYFTTNEGGDPNIPIYILEKAAMVNGDANVSLQRVGIPKFADATGNSFQVATPADWDGALSPPPPGSPSYMVRMYDDAWDGGVDKLEVWEVSVDWADANNTTVVGPIDLPTEAFDSDLCQGNIFQCLTDAGGNVVSALMQVVMHRVQYRNFGSYETMVLNHSVDVDGNNLAGVRWYELRKPSGGEWSIYQQGTVSPDANNRWMASIAMDGAGNIGLGYTIMGPDNDYDLAYTGRRSSDPLGQMTIDEFIFAEGLSFNPFTRWGDYSMMSVDEEDGRTFWYTGEYMGANEEWATKIVSFILTRDTVDVGPLSVVTPQSSGFLTNAETVEVEVKNFGLEGQINFDVGLIVDDVFIEAQAITDTLKADSVVNVVFSTPVDMSVIGDYNLKIYTNLATDGNILNDTLRQVISKLTRFDLGVTNITNLDEIICANTAEAGITFTNFGVETITTADIEWSLNGGATQTINWTGSLATGASETVMVTLDPLMEGVNNLSANTSIPNGMADEDMSNDGLSRDFTAFVSGGFIELALLTDNFPAETTWQLADDNGAVIYEGGPYTEQQTVINEQLCVGDGCYTFTIFDSYGDGIQFNGVEGDYTITDQNGIIVASLNEVNFGFEESNFFCTPFECTLDGSATTINESIDGADDGVISISESNGAAPFEYSIDGGTTFSNNSLFDNVGGGTYDVVVVDAIGCSTTFQVTVGTCTISASADVVNTIEGQEIGSITVNVDNGADPLTFSINGGPFETSNVFENLGAAEYTIVVRDDIGCERTLTVVVDATVSTSETTFGNSIKVFPNPTEGKFQINIKGVNASTMNIRMLDATGKVIQRNRLVRYGDELTGFLSLRNFPVGVYFVEFEHEDIKRMVKIVRM